MIDKEKAITLRHGQILHHNTLTMSNGEPLRVRVSGKCQTWRTRPTEFRVPVKFGLYRSDAITHENGEYWSVAGEEAA